MEGQWNQLRPKDVFFGRYTRGLTESAKHGEVQLQKKRLRRNAQPASEKVEKSPGGESPTCDRVMKTSIKGGLIIYGEGGKREGVGTKPGRELKSRGRSTLPLHLRQLPRGERVTGQKRNSLSEL